jgi:hypothetical protein
MGADYIATTPHARHHGPRIPGLDAADQGEDLARGEIERVQGEPEIGVLQEREEAVCAVVRPPDHHRVLAAPDLDLDERGPLPDDGEPIPRALERAAVGGPRRRESRLGVVEEVDVAGEARGAEELVEGGPARDVALAAPQPGVG